MGDHTTGKGRRRHDRSKSPPLLDWKEKRIKQERRSVSHSPARASSLNRDARNKNRRHDREATAARIKVERDNDNRSNSSDGRGDRSRGNVERRRRSRSHEDRTDRRSRNQEERRGRHRNRWDGDGDKRDESKMKWGRHEEKEEAQEASNVKKQQPNLGLSGKLNDDATTYNGIVIKYSEPPEAKKPRKKWRLYPFKGDKSLPFIPLHRQSAYLLGRERLVADIPIDHPSCSKQHAALQFRLVPFERPDGSKGRRVRPYIIDLGSANGTFVNNKQIDPSRYVELLEKDVIKFGFSSREYVLLHEETKEDDDDEVAE